MKKLPVVVIVGTRPEAIKMAPVIARLSQSRKLKPITVSTSQHRHMVGQIFDSFGIEADHELRVMRKSQTLSELSGRLVARLGKFLGENHAAAVLVQGDTSSAFFGGLSAYYHQLPVGHVEAGLRTGNRYAPFPEEMNRTLLASIATWHFAPTKEARRRLLKEGVPRSQIYLTGNTVVDALRWMAPRCTDAPLKKVLGSHRLNGPLILVTCHRRESLGAPMRDVASALAHLARRNPRCTILFPIHPNPAVRGVIMPRLEGQPNAVLCEPLNYLQFLSCLKHAFFVISDSGGVQTERQEGVRAGALKLVGTDPKKILTEAEHLLQNPAAYRRMSRASDVFGDGRSARRIVRILERSLA